MAFLSRSIGTYIQHPANVSCFFVVIFCIKYRVIGALLLFCFTCCCCCFCVFKFLFVFQRHRCTIVFHLALLVCITFGSHFYYFLLWITFTSGFFVFLTQKKKKTERKKNTLGDNADDDGPFGRFGADSSSQQPRQTDPTANKLSSCHQ